MTRSCGELSTPTEGTGRQAKTGSARGVGFADALIVFKALRTAASDGELLNGVYTFDAAMQRLPHVAAP